MPDTRETLSPLISVWLEIVLKGAHDTQDRGRYEKKPLDHPG